MPEKRMPESPAVACYDDEPRHKTETSGTFLMDATEIVACLIAHKNTLAWSKCYDCATMPSSPINRANGIGHAGYKRPIPRNSASIPTSSSAAAAAAVSLLFATGAEHQGQSDSARVLWSEKNSTRRATSTT